MSWWGVRERRWFGGGGRQVKVNNNIYLPVPPCSVRSSETCAVQPALRHRTPCMCALSLLGTSARRLLIWTFVPMLCANPLRRYMLCANLAGTSAASTPPPPQSTIHHPPSTTHQTTLLLPGSTGRWQVFEGATPQRHMGKIVAACSYVGACEPPRGLPGTPTRTYTGHSTHLACSCVKSGPRQPP